MSTKLTLRLDKDLIDSAKQYSASTGKSVSRLVADLFRIIRDRKPHKEMELSPTVKSLKGILKGQGIDQNDYGRYLEEKYL